MTTPVERLRRIAERAAILGEDGQWLAAALRRYLQDAAEGLTLDQAVGVAGERGRERWWNADARRRRDQALRELARRFFGNLPVADQAARVAEACWRYETTAWRFDRFVETMPPGYAGTPKEYLFSAFRAKPGSLRLRQLRAILEGGDVQ